MKHQPKPSPAWRGWPRRGRVWRGPGAFYRTARKDDRPHIRQPLRACHLLPREKAYAMPGDIANLADYTPSVCLYRQTAPPTQGSQRHAGSASRPTSVSPCGLPPSPQGEGVRHAGRHCEPGRLHPLSLPLQADSSPYTGEPTPRRRCAPSPRRTRSRQIVYPSCGNPIRVSAFCHIKRRNPQWHPTVLCGSTRKFRRNCPP